jgi:16S rRNA (cytosine967-C5)-methyltransferase
MEIGERILVGLFICSSKPEEILEELRPQWNECIDKPISEKLALLDKKDSFYEAFPWSNELSSEIDTELFILSHFIQPDLFLRIRPGHEKPVKEKLARAGISFIIKRPDCLALSNSVSVDEVIELDREAVIQDYNSQRIGEFLPVTPGKPEKVWDCCAGSGGKSILAYDLNDKIELTVSDIRQNILANLRQRFQNAGIKTYKYQVADLTNDSGLTTKYFDLVICDAPCTGSGVWSRTPEQLYYFDPEKILRYQQLQKNILKNVIRSLKPGSYLLYSTCSVFKKENEEIVQWLNTEFQLETMKTELLKGYDKKADTLFAALLQKRL